MGSELLILQVQGLKAKFWIQVPVKGKKEAKYLDVGSEHGMPQHGWIERDVCLLSLMAFLLASWQTDWSVQSVSGCNRVLW